jgi:hypothetical protein
VIAMDNMMIIVGKGVKYQEIKDFQDILRKANCNVDRFNIHYNEMKAVVGSEKETGLFLEIGNDIFEGKQVSELLKSALRTRRKLSEEKLEKLVVEHIEPVWVMTVPVKELREEKIDADRKDWD